MDMMDPPDFRVLAQGRARCFSHTARVASIRYATVLGSILAFALLCTLSARVNAAPVVDARPRAESGSGARPLGAPAARDAVVARGQSADDLVLRGGAFATDLFDAPPASDRSLLQDGIAAGDRHAGTAWCALLAVLLTLAGLAVIAFYGWRREHIALKRAVENLRRAESEWHRRYIEVEAREQAAHAVAAMQPAVATQERDRILAAMRHFVSGPLSALAALLEALDSSSVSLAQRPLAGKIQSAARTCVRVLDDVLASSPSDSRAIVLDESLTDLRELVDGVVALFLPAALQKGLCLSASIDRSVAACIVADSARLGQIVFHLVSDAVRSTERGQITVAARAESLNAGSQRVFICVRDTGATSLSSVTSTRAQSPSLSAAGKPADESVSDGDSGFALCLRLAQRMRGELAVSREPGFGTRRMFSAPFAIERSQPSEAQARRESQAPRQASAAQTARRPASTLAEPFDPSYLDALSNEGIDLHIFVRGWRQSMGDDLERMRDLRDRRDVGGVRESLHRLSGAVGLVGARSLMEGLRSTSVAEPEPEAGAIEALAKRIESLMMQLDEAIGARGSNLS